MEKKFTFRTRQGSWRLFVLMMAFVFLFAMVAQLIVTRGFKVSVTEVNLELRGGTLNMEVYRPSTIEKGDKLPCMILAHGGSECLATPVIHAWEYAKRGYVVLNVSMYGAGLSDMPEYMEDGADETNYSRNSGTHGLWDALQYARNIDYVDTTRIGIWGHSQGYTIGCTVPIFDGNLYTLNDRLLNILYDEFGVEISEEELLRDADEIAAEKLTAEQLAVYGCRKAEAEEIVANYVNAVRIMEGSATGRKVTVAGHEVQRDLQCNQQVGGETRGGACGPFVRGTNPMDMVLFHSEEPLADNSWYAVPDATEADPVAPGELLGGIYDIDISTSAALKEAIENRNAYFFFDPVIHHNGNLWSPRAVNKTIQFFTQCLEYNNGELTDPATKPIPTKNLTSSYVALAFSLLAMLSLMGALCALASALLKSEYFGEVAFEPYAPKLKTKTGTFRIACILAFITSFIGGYVSSRENIALKASNAFMSKFLPTEPCQFRLIFQIIATAGVGLLLFGILGFVTRKKNDDTIPRFKDLNVGIGFKRVMRTVLLAVILFAAAYVSAAAIKGMACMRFMSIDVSLELMRPYAFVRMLKYAIMLLPFTLLISILNNLTVVDGVSDSKDVLISVLMHTIGAYVFVVVAYLIVFGPGTPTQMGSIQANMGIQTILPLLTMVPVCNYLYRRLFKVSGSAWLGAVFVALFLAWRLAAFTSHRFMFWGYDSVISRFFGF